MTNDEGVISGILADFCEYRKTTITKEAIAKADYTKACIQESYRIRPTAFCLARILEENMELSGYQLKAGVGDTFSWQIQHMIVATLLIFYFSCFLDGCALSEHDCL